MHPILLPLIAAFLGQPEQTELHEVWVYETQEYLRSGTATPVSTPLLLLADEVPSIEALRAQAIANSHIIIVCPARPRPYILRSLVERTGGCERHGAIFETIERQP